MSRLVIIRNCSFVASIITAVLSQNNLWPCISSALLVSTWLFLENFPHTQATELFGDEWKHLWNHQKTGFNLSLLKANEKQVGGGGKGTYRNYIGGFLVGCLEPWPGNSYADYIVITEPTPVSARSSSSSSLSSHGFGPHQTPEQCLMIIQNSSFWKFRLAYVRDVFADIWKLAQGEKHV